MWRQRQLLRVEARVEGAGGACRCRFGAAPISAGGACEEEGVEKSACVLRSGGRAHCKVTAVFAVQVQKLAHLSGLIRLIQIAHSHGFELVS